MAELKSFMVPGSSTDTLEAAERFHGQSLVSTKVNVLEKNIDGNSSWSSIRLLKKLIVFMIGKNGGGSSSSVD